MPRQFTWRTVTVPESSNRSTVNSGAGVSRGLRGGRDMGRKVPVARAPRQRARAFRHEHRRAAVRAGPRALSGWLPVAHVEQDIERERGSVGRMTIYPDAAAVCLRYRLHEREAEPPAAQVAALGRRRPAKRLEQLGNLALRNRIADVVNRQREASLVLDR